MKNIALKDSKTFVNLARTYIGESCARNRYEMLAKLAKKEGYQCLNDTILTIAENEFNHSRMVFSWIDSAKDKDVIYNITVTEGIPFKQKLKMLAGNLELAILDEANESEKIYPEFKKVAMEEGFTDIANFYENLIQVETCHKKLFTILADQLKNGTMYKRTKPMKWKCSACGHEETLKEAWTVCPLCQAPQGYVMLHIEDGAN